MSYHEPGGRGTASGTVALTRSGPRTHHWSLENETMKRMPAGSRAIYARTTELSGHEIRRFIKRLAILAPSFPLAPALTQAGT